MKRKLLGLLLAAIIAMVGVGAYSMTWTSCHIAMTANSASIIDINQYVDCDCTTEINTHNWNGVVQDQEYEVTVYVRNVGTEAVYITYLPTDISKDDDQTRMTILCYVIEGPATPCQLNPVTPDPLPEKDPLICDSGFLLNPGKVIKVDIVLLVHSVVSGGNWAFDFYFHGCAP